MIKLLIIVVTVLLWSWPSASAAQLGEQSCIRVDDVFFDRLLARRKPYGYVEKYRYPVVSPPLLSRLTATAASYGVHRTVERATVIIWRNGEQSVILQTGRCVITEIVFRRQCKSVPRCALSTEFLKVMER